MAENKDNLQEWSERLEAGARDDELLAVAARLESAAKDEPSAPTIEFRRQLRRDLLNRHAAQTNRATGRLWRWAGSVAALGLLAVLIGAFWLTMSGVQRPSFGGIAATEGNATPFYIPTAPVSAAALGSYSVNAPDGLEAGRTLELLAYWHVPDDLGATGAFAQLQNDAGQVVAQADGPLTDMGGEAYEVKLAIPLPNPLSDGSYSLLFGLSDATGARLPLYDFARSIVVYEEPVSYTHLFVSRGSSANSILADWLGCRVMRSRSPRKRMTCCRSRPVTLNSVALLPLL